MVREECYLECFDSQIKIYVIRKRCRGYPQSVHSFIAVDIDTGLKYSFECYGATKLLVNWSDDYEGGEYDVVRL